MLSTWFGIEVGEMLIIVEGYYKKSVLSIFLGN